MRKTNLFLVGINNFDYASQTSCRKFGIDEMSTKFEYCSWCFKNYAFVEKSNTTSVRKISMYFAALYVYECI